MIDEHQPIKKKRGRPRKNADKLELPIQDQKKDQKKENIVLFLALSDEESIENDSGEDNRFTINDTETNIDIIDSISESDNDPNELVKFNTINTINTINKQLTVNVLIDEVKKRDNIIAKLKNKRDNITSACIVENPSNINYQCVLTINTQSNKLFVPEPTQCDCWWCDNTFNDIPSYIVNYYRNNIYYVYGIFCSFNCALKYNVIMLKDFKCNTRYALTNSLRIKVTGISTPIKFAGNRELLKSKGGNLTIEQFREGFSVISANLKLNIPELIQLKVATN